MTNRTRYYLTHMDNFNLSDLEDLKDNNEVHASEDEIQSLESALGEETTESSAVELDSEVCSK